MERTSAGKPSTVDGTGAPLAGITVVDLTHALAGPYATLLLAGLGATVIKVERPGGDLARENAPYLGARGLSLTRTGPDDVSVPFLNRNRGKQTVTLDLTGSADRARLGELIEHADLVVENLSPGAADRLGVGYAFARARNPAVVYCSISGFGSEGGAGKAMDVIIQALSGAMLTSGPEHDPPVRIGFPVADLVAPLFAVIGSLAALRKARETGRGEHVDVSMLGALTSLLACEDFDAMAQLGLPSRSGNSLPRLAPFGVYPAVDGHVAVCAPSDAFATGLFAALGAPELRDDERFRTRDARVAHSGALDAEITRWCAPRRVPDILAVLHAHGVPAAPVRTPSQALRDERVRCRREVVPLEHPRDGATAEVLGAGLPIRFSGSRLPQLPPPAPVDGDRDPGTGGLDPAALGSLAEVERAARHATDRAVWDSIAGGAHDEVTVRENRRAFRRYALLPRHFTDVTTVDPTTTVLGREVDLPVLLAPVGAHELMHPDAELATARAASDAGTVLCLATGSTRSIERVAAVGAGRKWFQLYHFGRELSAELLARAEAAGFEAVVVTVDVPVPYASKERNRRNGFDPHAGLVQANFAGGPGWVRPPFTPVTWDELAWMRTITRLPVLVKGVLAPDEATRCVDAGAAGIVVSNHGGRMLDGAAATCEALPAIVSAVAGRAEVLVDGGVRRGSDVVTALALGAGAVLIGRPFCYGLAVAGAAGVSRVLEILRSEIAHTMAFTGCTRVSDIGPELLLDRGRCRP